MDTTSDEAVTAAEVIDIWNDAAKRSNIIPVKEYPLWLTEKINKLLPAHPKAEVWRDAAKKAESSIFLNGGEDRKGWRISLNWVVKDENNLLKLLYGKYDNKDTWSKKKTIQDIPF